MKKLTFLLISLFACLTVFAEKVTEQQALQIAQKFMQGKQFKQQNLRRAPSEISNNAYYVFNVENNGGFVIVAGDNRMPEILGYSENGSLNSESAPCNVKWLLDYYTKVVSTLPAGSDALNRTKRSAKTAIRPMITTTWGQGTPYNDLCPFLNGQHCLTGCVATALAQVINYNRWPQGPTNSVAAFKPQRLGINMPQLEPTSFNWDNMTNADVARLMLYCGQAVEMDYGLDASGASSYRQSGALIKVFGFSQTAHEIYRGSYSDEEWEDIIYNEMAESRPVVYDGDSNGSGGHAFVVHGYKDGMFYINWGWDGNEDGYFRLTGLNTSSGNFNDNQIATISIQSPAGGIVNRPKVVVREVSYYGHRFVRRTTDGSFPSINLSTKLVSDLSENRNIYTGIGLYDENGMVKVLFNDSKYFAVGQEYLDNVSFIIGNDVHDGTYRVVPISRTSETEDWIADANSSDYYLEISIDGQWMRIRSFLLSLDEQAIEDVAIASIDGISYSFYKRKGENCATILCFDEGKPSGEVYIPNNVTFKNQSYLIYRIEDDVFVNCPDLTSLSIATTNAPYIENCQNLTKIDLREGVCTMKGGISGCNNLISIEFPRSLTTIEHGPEWCDKLESMSFASQQQVTFIFTPQWNDEKLPALRNVSFMSENPPIIMFQDQPLTVTPAITIHVPKGTKASYENSIWNGWNIVDDMVESEIDGIVWGYCDGFQVSDLCIYDDCGNNDGEYALHVPAEMLAAYKGMTISHIQFYQPEEMCDYVFITKPDTDYMVKQEAIKLQNSWMDVELAHPYTITGEELYVGVGRKGKIATYCSDTEAKVPEGFWFRTMGNDPNTDTTLGEWNYVPDRFSGFTPPIPLRFVISGDKLPTDMAVIDVSVQNDSTSQKAQLTVHNRSKELVSKFTVNWDVDSSQQGSKAYEAELNPGRSTTVSFYIPDGLDGRYHKLGYSISEVNGIADAISANSTGIINFRTAGGHPDDGPLIVNNVELKDGEVWWYNHDVNALYDDGNSSCVGTQYVGVRYYAAIYIPKGLAGGKGTTIDGFSFYRNTLACQNVTLWVSTHLPNTEMDADIEILDIPNNQLSTEESKYHQVAFSQPHEIPEGGLYVGYSFDITADMMNAGYPCAFTKSIKNRKGGFWMKASNHPKWDEMTEDYGNLIAQVLMGGNVYKNAVRISDFSYASAVIGGKTKAEVILCNEGANKLNSVTLNIVGENGSEYERNATLTVPLAVQMLAGTTYVQATATFELDADAAQGADKKTITVTKVNGADNELQKGISTTGTLYTLVSQPTNTTVLENRTSTISGGGAMNMTIRKILSEEFGNKLIPIAVHSLDIMAIDEYQQLSNMTYNLEQGFVNRERIKDMYRGDYYERWGIKKVIQDAQNTIVPGSVTIDASWADDDMNVIDIHTDTRFMMDADNLPFRLGFVLLEDGLHGTGSAWAQANQLSGYNDLEDEAFDYWVSQPNPIEGLKFDNVPVAAWSPFYGIEESVSETVKAGESNVYNFKANIAGNRLIQNKENLSVVALLVDKQNGTIINGSKCKIDAYGTGISSLSVNDQAFDIYTLQGHKVRAKATTLDGLPKGVYIVNGNKVVIK